MPHSTDYLHFYFFLFFSLLVVIIIFFGLCLVLAHVRNCPESIRKERFLAIFTATAQMNSHYVDLK